MRRLAREMYQDRRDAGRELAAMLGDYRGRDDVVVLGLTRGGVPVASEVARGLGVPLDVIVVRKLGFPPQSELAMGAIAPGGVLVLNQELEVSAATIDTVAAREEKELRRRELVYRGDREPLDIAGKTVILVDDGLATGSSMRAAIASVRARHAESVIVAVPVGATSTCDGLAQQCDRLVCPLRPEGFGAVGEWYTDFREISDEDVRRLLARTSWNGR